MNKIIPILCISVACMTAVLAVMALIAVCASITTNFAVLVSVPAAIISFVLSTVNTAFAFLFKKDILCRIAFFIDLAAFVLSVVSVIIWLAVL